MRRLAEAAASITVLVAVAASGGCGSRHREPTLLADFSAPFVFGRFEVPTDNPLTEESVELGRRLFYDQRLSGSNTMSCSTCHQQRLAFTDGRRTGIGVSGKPLAFNSMSLAARRLRAQNGRHDMRLVAVTGYGQPGDRRRSQAAGFDEHLVKPVEPALLNDFLRSVRS